MLYVIAILWKKRQRPASGRDLNDTNGFLPANPAILRNVLPITHLSGKMPGHSVIDKLIYLSFLPSLSPSLPSFSSFLPLTSEEFGKFSEGVVEDRVDFLNFYL